MSLVQVIKVVDVKRTLTWKFYIMRILPVGFFMALTLHFGNTVYLYLTVSFIQMLKARTPPLPSSHETYAYFAASCADNLSWESYPSACNRPSPANNAASC